MMLAVACACASCPVLLKSSASIQNELAGNAVNPPTVKLNVFVQVVGLGAVLSVQIRFAVCVVPNVYWVGGDHVTVVVGPLATVALTVAPSTMSRTEPSTTCVRASTSSILICGDRPAPAYPLAGNTDFTWARPCAVRNALTEFGFV